MHIKSIELNGFKSYGTKTVIKGFDPFFNAITGLNGSGKSNILDSICFVLGISNLTHVRATNLQDLVYKNGQAGISKASVSIVFDNSDRHHSPVGYENIKEITVTRIVIVGGRNKYFINGTIANNSRVQDFFQSVGLNVNNPHFLIMQGRITKVLNMKPHEILSMVEEAAGTRMYETKKDVSIKLMAKKEDRLQEIDNILTEDITPTLTKLKEERKDYIEYTKVVRECDHLSKLVHAWEFLQAEGNSLKCVERVQSIKQDLEVTSIKIGEHKVRIDSRQEAVTEMEKKRDAEIGGVLSGLEEDLKNQQMEEAKISNKLKNSKNQLKDDNKKKAELNQQLKEEKDLLIKKEAEVGKSQKEIEKLEVAWNTDKQAKEAAFKKLQDINAGLYTNSEGQAQTLAAQLMDVEGELAKAKSTETVAKNKLSFLTKDLSKKVAECKGGDTNFKKTEASYKAVEKEINSLQESLKKLNFEEGLLERLEREKVTLEKEINTSQDSLDMLRSKYPQLNFEYVDPERNFDRKRINGLVCNLFKIKSSSSSVALEIASGARLFNVVVDNEQTGKILLSKGKLKQRCTLIPLNKIIGRPIPANIVKRAKALVGDKNVSTALELITYNSNVASAIEYVFGGIFVCSDMNSACKVAFDENIKIKCVTLEGEVVDPAGTISGGSMGQRGKILKELEAMNDIVNTLQLNKHKYQEICKRLQDARVIAQKYMSIQENLDIKMGSLENLKRQLEASTFHQQKEEIANLKLSIDEQNSIITECQKTVKSTEKKVKDLQLQINNEKSQREAILKKANDEVDLCQAKCNKSEGKFEAAKQKVEQLFMEIEDIKKGCNTYEQQLTDLVAEIEKHQKETDEMEAEHNGKKQNVAEVLDKVKEQKVILKKYSQDVAKMHKEIDALKKELEEATLHKQQLEHDATNSEAIARNAREIVKKIVAQNPWIEEEKKFFGVANSQYDFSEFDAAASSARVKKLEDTRLKLGQTVNSRAQVMLTDAEEQYRDLMGKKKVVLLDREKIKAVMNELDEKKREALKTACKKVNHDFGSIFSTLLPGAKAQLAFHEEDNNITGLSFNVGFGDKWKESLTELSGGQRSLVALSLILSLLLFKPAPIYILDEVDAALDLSHTQNIGTMLKRHFDKSQFIVVSLKDGMFNNANVLFRTKFVDGMSTVARTTVDQLQL